MTVGVVHKRSTVLVSSYIGTRRVDGGAFQIGFNPSSRLPIIRSKDTCRVWVPTWDALVRLAISEGILASDDSSDRGGAE
ncbi:MAG: hypothetical protein AAB214_07500 [Fibrobacterota bacterium]